MTVVGKTPVVINHDSQVIHLGTKKSMNLQAVDLTTDPVVLQAMSESGSSVAYATTQGLVVQPLGGQDPEVTSAEGIPSQPVVVDGCTYGVWSQTGDFIRDCIGETHDLKQAIPDFDVDDELRFRVNWGHIVLNQIKSGGIWLVTDLVVKVDNWEEALRGDEGNEDQDSTEEIDENEKIDRSGDNRPPVARDDEFGARPGRSVLLPVVENDIDEDGDLLTVELLGSAPAGFDLNLVYSQAIIQMNVPATASGVVSFAYRVHDGRGGESTASVTVAIRPESENSAPETARATVLTVSSGQRVTHNVLTNWRDPDGDTIFLLGAEAPQEDSVTVTQDGTLTFQDGGLTTGVKTVQVTVSDGQESNTQEIMVNVLPSGNRPPVATPDLVSGTVDTPIEIRPLDNDTDPNGNSLRLTGVEGDPAKCVLEKELTQGLVTATCSEPGSVYLTYTVTDGPSANVESWIRVLVIPKAAGDEPPIAVPDTVLLSPGQDAFVTPLDNDVNPLGFPLVVTSVGVDSGLPVSVSVLEYERVKITPNQEFSSPISISYTVSNGKGYASSRITVVPLPAPDKVLPPTAVDDTVTVRVGDIATVSVLSNDTQANGIALRLRPDLPETPDPDTEALVFTSGNTVRVHARQEPGTYTVLYQVEVVKGSAEPDTGRLTIYVTPQDEGGNQAPKPKDVQARTRIGNPVNIEIPLNGVDPNGDHVTVTGLASAPGQGIITSLKGNKFVYEPGANTTGDEFTYVVRDRLGLESTGRVRIGVAPASDMNLPPNAVTDFAEAIPGGKVTIPVTMNDTDPDGDICCYLKGGSVQSEFFTGEVDGQEVIIQAPDQVGSYWGTYTVSDEFYQESTGVIVLTVAEDIQPKKPLVTDDEVSTLEALLNTSMTLEVLANDYDPDGDKESLVVSVDDPTVSVSANNVTVPITADLQIIDYYVTDPDGQVGHGFITVPGADLIPPQYNPEAKRVEVRSGETISFALADHVIVRTDRSPRVVDAAGITAWNGSATAPSVTQLSFTAPDNYQGPAAISVKVTDGATLEDDTGIAAVVTIPVKVLPGDKAKEEEEEEDEEEATIPVMRSTALEVEVGEGSTFDLATLVSNVQPTDRLTYSLLEGPSLGGVEASLSGSTLTASAGSNVPSGSESVLRVSVTLGEVEVEATVTIKIVGTRRPLPQAVDDMIPSSNQGQTVCVPVTSNDTNPFPNDSLTVVSASVETGDGQAVVGCGGGQGVNVTPAASFLGEMVVRYVIVDVTQDPNRQSTGRIYLNVRGRPSPPTGVHIDQVGDRQVILSWMPADNNGAPLSGYTVSSSPPASGYPLQCPTTTCILNGLTNNVTYRFTVTATNEVGTSDPSMASDEARPDAIPNRLDAPVLAFGNKSLTITWIPRGSPGSPVTSYDLEISPPPPSGQAIVNVTGTSYVWSGLSNGTEYQVMACARNLAPGVCEQASHWSPLSLPQIPAGPPDPPVQPTWTRLNPVGSEGQVEVCWTEPYNNGDRISSYTLTSSSGVTYTVTPTGGRTCRTTTLPSSENGYTFKVAAHNKAGQGQFSVNSDEFRSVIKPGPVSNLSTQDRDKACVVSFSPAALNGAKSSEVTYHWRASSGQSGDFGTSTSGTASGLANSDNAITITVWARTSVQGFSQDGEERSVTSCRPFGPVNKPGATAERPSDRESTKVILGWSRPSWNGRRVTYVMAKIDTGSWWETDGLDSGTISIGDGWGQTHTIWVKACDSEGQCSENSASTTAHSKPAAEYWLYVNPNDCVGAVGPGLTGGCRGHIGFNKWALEGGGTYTVTCSWRQPNGMTGSITGQVEVGRASDGSGYMACPKHGGQGGLNGYVNKTDVFTVEIHGVTSKTQTMNW